MSDEFATVLSCWSVEEAHLARIHLAAEGIDAHLDNEKMIGMAWLDANAIRGVRLLVKEADATRALEILGAEHHPESSDTIPIQSGAANEEGADIPLISPDEDQQERDSDNTKGTLTAFRSLKGPVIWGFLAPSLLMPVILLAMFIGYLARLFGL